MNNLFCFTGGSNGQWRITALETLLGDALETATHLSVYPFDASANSNGQWTLKGFTSNIRYAEKNEKEILLAKQANLGRQEATFAALIPIRKTEEWWALAQDERRAIFEAQSHHTRTGIKYLPAVARKLYHCRDIGESFDFLTWFEYAPSDASAFEELLMELRKTEEWKYVDREIDIRLSRE